MFLKLGELAPIGQNVPDHFSLSLNFCSLLLGFSQITPNLDVRLFFVKSEPRAVSCVIVGGDGWQHRLLTLAFVRAAALRLEMEVY